MFYINTNIIDTNKKTQLSNIARNICSVHRHFESPWFHCIFTFSTVLLTCAGIIQFINIILHVKIFFSYKLFFQIYTKNHHICALLCFTVVDENDYESSILSDPKNLEKLLERPGSQDYTRLGLCSLSVTSGRDRSSSEPFRISSVNANFSVSRRLVGKNLPSYI